MDAKTEERVVKSDTEWQKRLTPMQFKIARRKGTERAFTGEYWDHHETGIYRCVCCGAELFSSEHKFDSGTGWPSYWQPITPDAVATKTDFKMIIPRTECHCATCGLHMGHVFKDGPPPTGERWCINGVVLDFRPEE